MTTTVETIHGAVRGMSEGGLDVFRGIPFARPPIGDLRFRPPQKPDAWSGERPADTFGFIAPQPEQMRMLMPGPTPDQNEDCLTLNVWTPGCDGAGRPVMVWIHGGAFVTGSGSGLFYAGDRLARRGDVVVVTINYRLGALGWLSHPDLRDPETGAAGNWGLLDQIAALEWVRDNIVRFGGDPSNVTIFGESAGSMSVSTLLGTPAARGLFHRAIAQSGGPMAMSAARATKVAELLVEEAGVDSVAALRTVPVETLLAAQTAVQLRGVGLGLPMAPAVDGVTLREPPLDAIAAGNAQGVDLLVGTNRDEMKFFALADQALLGGEEEFIRERLVTTIGHEAHAAIDVYSKARADRGESTAPLELWSAIESDRVFRIPSLRMADAQSATGSRVYDYLFTWETPALGGILGSCHALEIPFVFGTIATPGVDRFTGSGPEAEALSEAMQDAWLGFARTGDPSTPSLGEWPPYRTERRSTMILGRQRRVEDAPYEPERAYWAASAAATIADD